MAESDSDYQSDFLYEDDSCLIDEEADGLVWLRVFFSWSPAMAALARRFKVRGLSVCIPPKGDPSLDFLAEVPNLRAIHVTSHPALAWNKLECLTGLEKITLSCDYGKPPEKIDFPRFKKLTYCCLSWSDSWASILQAKSLRKLHVNDAEDLVDLDCTQLKRLEMLTLYGCFALKSFNLAESTKLRRLWINGAPKLKPDWQRISRDLEDLSINGRIASPLEELRQLRKLILLHLLGDKRIKSLAFLRDLPRLAAIYVDADLSKADRALVNEINENGETRFKKWEAANS
jgi:hypothetical protein